MSTAQRPAGRIGAQWRWGALLVAALVAIFLLWFFVFRNSSSGGGPTSPPPSRPALGQTLPYEQYVAAVNSALDDVRAAQPLSGDERKKKLDSARAALEKVEGADVSPAGGSPSEVDNTLLISELSKDEPDVTAVEGSLALLASEVQSSERGGVVTGTASGQQAMQDMRDVLNDPAFSQQPTLLQRLTKWLADRIQLPDWLTANGDPQFALTRLLLSIIAGLAAGVVTFFVSERLGLRNRWARLGLGLGVGIVVGIIFYVSVGYLDTVFQVLAAVGLVIAAVAAGLIFAGLYRVSAPSAPRTISELAAVLGMNAQEARQRAEDAAGAQDYKLAIRYRCLAVLLALDEAGLLTFDRSATNREYLFRASGPLHEELQPLLDRFDSVWYGEVPVGEADWQEYAARAARVEEMVAAEVRARKTAPAKLRSSAA